MIPWLVSGEMPKSLERLDQCVHLLMHLSTVGVSTLWYCYRKRLLSFYFYFLVVHCLISVCLEKAHDMFQGPLVVIKYSFPRKAALQVWSSFFSYFSNVLYIRSYSLAKFCCHVVLYMSWILDGIKVCGHILHRCIIYGVILTLFCFPFFEIIY